MAMSTRSDGSAVASDCGTIGASRLGERAPCGRGSRAPLGMTAWVGGVIGPQGSCGSDDHGERCDRPPLLSPGGASWPKTRVFNPGYSEYSPNARTPPAAEPDRPASLAAGRAP